MSEVAGIGPAGRCVGPCVMLVPGKSPTAPGDPGLQATASVQKHPKTEADFTHRRHAPAGAVPGAMPHTTASGGSGPTPSP